MEAKWEIYIREGITRKSSLVEVVEDDLEVLEIVLKEMSSMDVLQEELITEIDNDKVKTYRFYNKWDNKTFYVIATKRSE